MASAIKYMANVTKSIKYATFDVIKDLNPVVTDAIDTNEDVIKTTYSTIKNFKKITSKTYQSIKDSEITALASTGLKNTLEDLKNGTFYNRERIKKYENEQIENFMDDNDFSFSFGDEDGDSSDSFGSSNEFGMDDLADTIDSVGEKSSNAVSQVIVRGAEHNAKVNTRLVNQIMAQNTAMVGAIHGDISVVNTNLSNILKFNTDIMSTHIQNSAQFFSRQQEQMSEQTAILKEILDITKKKFGEEEKKPASEKVTVGDLLSAEGNLNIQNYAKYVKQNIKNKDSGMGDMIKLMMDMGFGKSAMASPLSYLLTGGIKKLTPKILKEALEEFNATLGGISGNLILKANGLKNRTDFLSNLGDILGVSQSYKDKYDTGKYKRTATAWSGEDHKALTEVIPTYLSKIYDSISGKGETRFDYETGKYVTEKQIRDQWKTKQLRDSMKSHGDLSDEMIRAIREQYKDNSKRQAELINTLNAVFADDLKNARVFNPRNKDVTAMTYGLKGGKKDEVNLKILMQLAQDLPNYQKLMMGQANAMLSTIADNNREMERLQENGSSVYNSLFNGSFGKEDKSSTSKDAKAAPVFDLSSTNQYLFNINKEVAYIRTFLTDGNSGNVSGGKIPKSPTGGGGSKKKRRGKRRSSNYGVSSFDEFTFYGNAIPKTANTDDEDDDISVITSDLDKKDAEKAKIEEKKKFLDKMVEANSLTDKMRVIINGVDDLVKSPAKLLAGVIKKADDRVYKLLFGEKDYNNGESIMDNLKSSLNTWLDNTLKSANEKLDKFGEMMEGKFSAERRKEFFNKVKKMFHIDMKGRSLKDFLFGENDDGWGANIVNMFKKGFGEEKDEVKDAFKSAKNGADKIFGTIIKGEKNSSGLFKDKYNKTQEEKEKAEKKKYEDLFNSINPDNIDNAATGMRRVGKTGLVAVSEGEMIIPPDMNPYNIAKREKNEQSAIDAFRNKFGKKFNFKKFTVGTTDVSSDDLSQLTTEKVIAALKKHKGNPDWLARQLENPEFQKIFNDIKKSPEGKSLIQPYMDAAQRLSKKRKHRAKFTINDYEDDSAPLLMRIGEEAKSGAKGLKDAAMETTAYEDIMNKIKKKAKGLGQEMTFKEVVNDTKNNFSKYLPRMAAGGVTGAIMSGVLGLVGGPLLGAAGGAAIGLVKNSSRLQSFLFGDEIVDEDGNKTRDYNSGKLPPKMSAAIDKYASHMGKGAIVGGLTSILPFVPGGPITGILVGSALGFASQNDKIKESLFGEDKLLGKLAQVLKKKLPRMGLGGIAGALASPIIPGGIITRIAIGSVLGMATDTEKFKDFLFGKKGFDDKRRGGVAGLIKEQFDRFGNFVKGLIHDFKTEFLEKDIIRPLRNFFKPLKQQGVNILKLFLRQSKEHIWAPIGTYLHKALTGTETVIGKLLFGTRKAREKKGAGRAGLVGVAKNIVTLPLRAASGAGNLLRRHQLNTGGAGDLTAEERLAERERLFLNGTGQSYIKRGINKLTGGRAFNSGRFEKSNWYSTDKALAGMNADQAKAAAMAAKSIALGSSKAVKKQVYAIFGKKPIDKLKAHFAAGELTSQQYNRIVNAVKSGNDKVISGYIYQSSIPDKYKSVAIKQLTDAAKKIASETKNVDNWDTYRNNAIQLLRGMGIDVAGTSKEKLFRIADYAEKEADFRLADEDVKTEEELKNAKVKENPMYILVNNGINGIYSRLDRYFDIMTGGDYSAGRKAAEAAAKKAEDANKEQEGTVEETKSTPETTEDEEKKDNIIQFPGNNNVAFGKPTFKQKIRKGILKFDRKLSDTYWGVRNKLFKSTDEDSLDTDNTNAIDTANNLSTKRKNKKANNGMIEKINANGKVMRFVRDRRGRLTASHSDPDTRQAMEEQEQQQSTQKGILAKMGDLASSFKEKFGGKEKEDGKKKKGSIFSTLFSMIFGSGIAKKVLAGGATLLGLGLLGKKFSVKQKDANGNVMYDENGNPILVEKTLADIIGSAGKKLWLGSDGSGETDGIWYGIKTYVPTFVTQMGENIGNVLSVYGPKLVQLICEQLPTYIAAALKGLGSGITSLVDKMINGDKKTTEANTQSNLETTHNTKSSVGQIIDSKTVSSNKNNKTDQATMNKMYSSAAFKGVNQNAQDKAARQLGSIWNQQTTLGKTVGEVLNDDSTVLATITDENGNEVQVTGANIVELAQHDPALGQQLLGVNLNLTEEDRNAYTEAQGDRIKKGGAKKKIQNGLFHSFMRGGHKNTRVLNKAAKASNAVGSWLLKRKNPIFKVAGGFIQGSATAPLNLISQGNQVIYDLWHSGANTAVVNRASALSNWADNKVAKRLDKGKKTGGIYSKISEKANNISEKFASKTAAKTDNVIDFGEAAAKKANKITNATESASKTASKANKIIDFNEAAAKKANKVNKIGAAIADNADDAAKVVSKIEDASGAASKINKTIEKTEKSGVLAKVSKALEGFLENHKVTKKLSDGIKSVGGNLTDLGNKSIENMMGEIAQKMCEKFLKKSPETAAKIGAKVSQYSTIVLWIADAVASFTDGMLTADVILKMKKPNAFWKVIAGIGHAVNNCIFMGIIDTGDIVEFFWKMLVTFFPSLKDSDYQKKRDELTKEVEEYNKENGENLNEEEYLKKNNKWVQFKDKVWNSRWNAPVRGAFNAMGSTATAMFSGAIAGFNGVKDAGKSIAKGDWKGAGKAIASIPKNWVKTKWKGIKGIGTNVANGVSEFFTGKKVFKSKAEKAAEKGEAYTSDATAETLEDGTTAYEGGQTRSSGGHFASAAQSAQDKIANSYITDENGNIVGSGVNADGTIDSMYIAQGDSSNDGITYDQTGMPNQVISNSNQQLIQQQVSEINTSIPTLVTAMKNKIANVFGVSTNPSASNKTGLLSLAKSAVTSVAKANPAYLFFKGINTMWNKINNKTSDMQNQMPDQIANAATAAANMAQTSVLGGSLQEVVTAGTNTKQQSLQDSITDLAVNNTNNSLGINIFKKGSNVVKKISTAIKKLFGRKTGKGSGLNDDANVKETSDPSVVNFISQKSSKYSSLTFGNSADKAKVKDAGCAPATATMAINANPMANGRLDMTDAIKHASPYLQEDGGVSADYFAQEFADMGMTPVYITSADKNYKSTIIDQLHGGNTVVLMGTDPNNTSKTNSPFGPTGHYVVAVGISSDGSTIYINDPEAKAARVPYDINTVLDSSELAIIPTGNKSKASKSILKKAKEALKSFKGMASGDGGGAGHSFGDSSDSSSNESNSNTSSSTDTSSTGTSTNNKKGSWLSGTQTKVTSISDALTVFDELAKYYGLSSSSSTSSTDSLSSTSTGSSNIDTSSISGNVSSDSKVAALQKALVAKMKSVEGTLKYQQNNTQYPGSRNPEEGGGDCSSTIQWAYKAVTGKDPGAWTGAMSDGSTGTTYEVTNSLSDESKLQLGDILLKNGHVEMYAGNGKMIGHGGGPDGKTLGPTTKDLGSSPPYNMVRRLNDFKGAGSGIFVSQNDAKYKNKSMGNETVGDSGCAPAAATMAANLSLTQNQKRMTMDDAIKFSQGYVSPSGVSADYFVKQFEARGLSSLIISGSDTSQKIMNILKGRAGAIVLLGRNPKNKSKSVSPFGSVSHYVVATAISKDGSTIYINDPEGNKENVPYKVDNVLPYVSLGIMPRSKGDSALDKASEKLSKALSKLSGKGKYANDSAEYITWNFLRRNGFSEHAAAGVMGNIQQESSFDIGSKDGDTNGGTGAHGLFQWQGDRYKELVQFAEDRGSSWDNLETQLLYFMQEFGGYDYWFKNTQATYNSVSEFKSSTNYIDAATSFELAFERASTPLMEKRIAYAKDFLEAFTGTAVDDDAIAKASKYTGGNSIDLSKAQTADEWYNSLKQNGISSITDVYTAFDKLAQYYGLSGTSSGGSGSSSNSNSSGTTKASSATATQYLQKFNSWKGITNDSDKQKEIIDIYNNNRADGAGAMQYHNNDWCQAAATAADMAIGDASVANTAHPPTGVNFYKTNNEWHDRDESGFTPQPGDQIYYSWNRNGFADHVGAVNTAPDSTGKFQTIEGNYGAMVQNVDRETSNTQIMGYGRPAWKDASGKGSGIFRRRNRFKENPKPISGFNLSPKGKGTQLETPVYKNTSTNSKTLQSPTYSPSEVNNNYSDATVKAAITQATQTAKSSSDNNSELISIIIKLLGKVVDNTTAIKDIATLVTAIVKNSSTSNESDSSSKSSAVDSEARALLLRNMKNANTENTSLEKLIANVEAIAQQ